jgi:endonuclease/exonuclease/phosphatase family metal-dependent hydrolase
MANFLFWNTNGKNIIGHVAQACAERQIDVLILAEFPLGSVALLQEELKQRSGQTYMAPFETSERLTFVTRYPLASLVPIHDEGGVAVRRINPPIGAEILVIAVHLPSRLYVSTDEQTPNAIRVSRKIDEFELQVSHSKTLVIGDFNMDPFDNGMIAADGLHGVSDRSIAKELSRTVMGEERKFFYNPMWSRYGDETRGPPGTYYRRGGQISHFWHMFDQVLLRPSLLEYYSSPSALQIIDKIGHHYLMKDGRIDKTISDHLPIFLRLDLERGV